eukprot:2274512-Rhodomonas_salina.2
MQVLTWGYGPTNASTDIGHGPTRVYARRKFTMPGFLANGNRDPSCWIGALFFLFGTWHDTCVHREQERVQLTTTR